MAITVEFWKLSDKLFVEYNKRVYNFNQFIKLSEAQFIIENIYNKILKDYPNESFPDNNMCHTVGTFIKNHFLIKDSVFDVIILEDGKTIKFNLEE